MHKAKIIVLLRGKTEVMSIDEAKTLQKDLSEKLAQQLGDRALQPPNVSEGYLTREAMYEFFSQVYPTAGSLQQHAGRLHGRFMNAIRFGTVSLGARCQNCHGDIHAKSCLSPKSNFGHCSEDERRKMEISVSDLRMLTLEKFTRATSTVGPATREDFELLRSHL